MDLYEELLALVEALDREECAYAVCGGIALAVHGHPRFTEDIDLLVPPDGLVRVLATARERGFQIAANPLRFDAGTSREREIRRISKIEGEDVLTLDLLILPPFLRDVWDDRERFDWQGQSMAVVSAPGLIKMKRIAGRTQDLADLERLEGNGEDGSS